MTHVRYDDWGEPVRLGPSEWEFEVAKLGSDTFRVMHWRGKLAGIEKWSSLRSEYDVYDYQAWLDPERPWMQGRAEWV